MHDASKASKASFSTPKGFIQREATAKGFIRGFKKGFKGFKIPLKRLQRLHFGYCLTGFKRGYYPEGVTPSEVLATPAKTSEVSPQNVPKSFTGGFTLHSAVEAWRREVKPFEVEGFTP